MDGGSQKSVRGPKYSLGSQLLERRLGERSLSLYAGERLADAPDGIFGRIIRGERGVGLGLAIKLRDTFKIPVDAWQEEPMALEEEVA